IFIFSTAQRSARKLTMKWVAQRRIPLQIRWLVLWGLARVSPAGRALRSPREPQGSHVFSSINYPNNTYISLRIRQARSFDFSIVVSTSPLRAVAILTQSDFHEVSRARSKARSQSNG